MLRIIDGSIVSHAASYDVPTVGTQVSGILALGISVV